MENKRGKEENKRGKKEKFEIGTDFPTFASFRDTYIYETPMLEFLGLIKVGCTVGNMQLDKRSWGLTMVMEELKK